MFLEGGVDNSNSHPWNLKPKIPKALSVSYSFQVWNWKCSKFHNLTVFLVMVILERDCPYSNKLYDEDVVFAVTGQCNDLCLVSLSWLHQVPLQKVQPLLPPWTQPMVLLIIIWNENLVAALPFSPQEKGKHVWCQMLEESFFGGPPHSLALPDPG